MPEDNEYMIFARKAYGQPLTEIGAVSVDAPEHVEAAALAAYPDDDWIEMVAVPLTAIVSAFEKV